MVRQTPSRLASPARALALGLALRFKALVVEMVASEAFTLARRSE